MQNKIRTILSGLFVLILAFTFSTVKAQNATDFKFNEILVYNESNFVDEFGVRSSWIELVNSSYSNINIAGCFLTDDLNNPTKYWIPTNDPDTKISPRGFIVFFADGKPSRGIHHLNFELKEGKTIALFDANGKTLIDKLEIVSGFKPDLSYSRISPDSNEWEFKETTTPGSDNDHSRKASAGEKFVEVDPSGAGMTMVAMFVVFSALATLFFFYKAVGHFFTKPKKKKKTEPAVPGAVEEKRVEISGEINAAIATALYLYQTEMHDFENTVLTIKKVSRTYSPWSSKIYTLRKTPR